MVVFQQCNEERREPWEPGCADKETIDETLDGSYLLLIENKETYVHQNNPSSDEMLLHRTHISWYAASNIMRLDH